MTIGFMNVTHCARMATRQALRTGEVVHVIATGNDTMPLMVIDEHQLFAHGDRLGPEELLFTADPFSDAAAAYTAKETFGACSPEQILLYSVLWRSVDD